MHVFFICGILALSGISATVSSSVESSGLRNRATSRGVVAGIENCGSLGTISEVRVTDCLFTPCLLYPGGTYNIQVDFSVGNSGTLWNVKIAALINNVEVLTIVDENLPAEILPEEWHMLEYNLQVSEMFAGMDIKVRIELTEVNTNAKEICVSAECTVRTESIAPTTEDWFSVRQKGVV